MSDHHESSSGSFLTGLIFGVAAGAVGFYLLKTDEGKKAKQKLMDEWEKAKDQLVDQGVIPKNMELPQVIQHTIQRMIEPPKKKMVKVLDEKEPGNPKTKKKKPDSGKKFKGV